MKNDTTLHRPGTQLGDLRFLPKLEQQEILLWYYKHALLNGWGSTELLRKLRTFEEGEEEYGVAEMYLFGEQNTRRPLRCANISDEILVLYFGVFLT